MTWKPHPRTVLSHEEGVEGAGEEGAGGGVPKVLANKLIVVETDGDGDDVDGKKKKVEEWILPFWREPVDSWIEYQHYHPLQENQQGRVPRPAVAPKGLAAGNVVHFHSTPHVTRLSRLSPPGA